MVQSRAVSPTFSISSGCFQSQCYLLKQLNGLLWPLSMYDPLWDRFPPDCIDLSNSKLSSKQPCKRKIPKMVVQRNVGSEHICHVGTNYSFDIWHYFWASCLKSSRPKCQHSESLQRNGWKLFFFFMAIFPISTPCKRQEHFWWCFFFRGRFLKNAFLSGWNIWLCPTDKNRT